MSVHRALLLSLPWRTWVCPNEAQVWRWHSCLVHRGSGSTRYSGESVARSAGNMVLLGFFVASGSSFPVGIKCECGGVAWISGIPAVPGTQGGKWLLSWDMALIGLFLASGCFAPVTIEHGGGTAAWILGTLMVPSLFVSWGPWQCQVCTNRLSRRSCNPIRVF